MRSDRDIATSMSCGSGGSATQPPPDQSPVVLSGSGSKEATPTANSGPRPLSDVILVPVESRSPVVDEQPVEDISFMSHSSSSNPRECDYVASCRNTKCKGDDAFNRIFRKSQEAIIRGMYPLLIPAGSSGSYFVRDAQGKNLAVFKPKDEEPFAILNPKWPKFFQRVLCFCCFGRACLIPNSGYLSETGASIVDSFMNLHVVPKTRVVKMASPTFYYSRCCGRVEVKPKEGSFQLFVHGYESAQTVFSRWEYDPSLLSKQEDAKFTFLFQKMCVLDYVIRNTDRHMDNLLIKHIPGKELELAAIDNGLAFPVKHPESASRFRTFPFRWSQLRWAKEPWSPYLREHLMSILSPKFVHDLCNELKILFRHSHATNRVLVYNQLRVVRGQLWNLRMALLKNESPSSLVSMEPVLVMRKYRRQCPTTTDWSQWFKVRPIDLNDRGCC